MTEYTRGYRDGLLFTLHQIAIHALEVRFFQSRFKMTNQLLDDIEAELKKDA